MRLVLCGDCRSQDPVESFLLCERRMAWPCQSLSLLSSQQHFIGNNTTLTELPVACYCYRHLISWEYSRIFEDEPRLSLQQVGLPNFRET